MHRFDIINHFIEKRFDENCRYLEIGVRNPADCFDRIKSNNKVSVDPGYEFGPYTPTFKTTSDDFFKMLNQGATHLSKDYKWDIVFIDGLHLASQCYRDLINAMEHIRENGVVVLHDCSPPEWRNAHSDYEAYAAEPHNWNGTCWKAFYYAKTHLPYEMYTVDTDWGVGVIDTSKAATPIKFSNKFFEFGEMKKDRQNSLGLITPQDFIRKLYDENVHTCQSACDKGEQEERD